MAIWDSQSIRAVWFIAGGVETPIDELFQSFFGFEPDATQRNKSPSPQNPFFALATGTRDDLVYEIQWQPGRFEVIISDNENIPGEVYPAFGTSKAIDLIKQGVEKNGSKLPDSYRIALVTTLVLPVADYATGREELARLSSFDPQIGDTSDFMLQLNKRKTLASGNEINRVLRWSVNSLQSVQLTMNMPSNGAQIPPTISGTKYAASVLLDINTVPNFMKVLVKEEQVQIFAELVSESLRLAEDRTVGSLAG